MPRNITKETQEAFRKLKAGEITEVEYQNELSKAKGFSDRNAEAKDMYKRQGFKTRTEYREHLAKVKGFPNLKAQLDSVAQSRGFKDVEDYRRQLTKIKRVKNGLPADMKANDKCSLWLGYVRGEEVLCKVFKDVKRMATNHPGYDFICNKNFKIDVKTSCLLKNKNGWHFDIDNNTIPDYFLLLAYDNRTDLNPMRIWLIRGDEIIKGRKLNDRAGLGISNTLVPLKFYEPYELTDKLDKVIECCDELKKKEDDTN